jgi:hypothetical protein
MKQSPQLASIQEQMKPGVLTLHGFLGTDERNLVDILIADDGEVRRLGLTHEQIGRRMSHFRELGRKGLGEYIPVAPHFDVRVETVRGKLPSPFGGPGLYEKTNTAVRNNRTGEEIVYSDLQIHLVRDHGFYEGEGSPFRLDPERIAAVLEIEPEDQ